MKISHNLLASDVCLCDQTLEFIFMQFRERGINEPFTLLKRFFVIVEHVYHPLEQLDQFNLVTTSTLVCVCVCVCVCVRARARAQGNPKSKLNSRFKSVVKLVETYYKHLR